MSSIDRPHRFNPIHTYRCFCALLRPMFWRISSPLLSPILPPSALRSANFAPAWTLPISRRTDRSRCDCCVRRRCALRCPWRQSPTERWPLFDAESFGWSDSTLDWWTRPAIVATVRAGEFRYIQRLVSMRNIRHRRRPLTTFALAAFRTAADVSFDAAACFFAVADDALSALDRLAPTLRRFATGL